MSEGLAADVGVGVGSFDLDAEVHVAPGETVAVLGPNGAGKSTLLRALAGLQPLRRGTVRLDGSVLDDAATGMRVPAERRSVGIVFQDQLLFPRLSALDNVAFGLRARGAPRPEARRQAGEWLEQVGVAERADARPAELSGGEAQRVALARALAVRPRLLLLDEPLAAVDASARPVLRRDLRRHLAAHDGAHVLVTHDPLEAAAMADRLVVLEEGRVVQTGTPDEVRRRPRSRYVADLVGVNLLRGRAGGGRIALAGGASLVIADDTDGDALAVVHPRAVVLHRRRPEGTARNVWEGTVEDLDPEGERARVAVAGPVPIVAEVTAVAVGELGLAEGERVWVSVKATEVGVFPA